MAIQFDPKSDDINDFTSYKHFDKLNVHSAQIFFRSDFTYISKPYQDIDFFIVPKKDIFHHDIKELEDSEEFNSICTYIQFNNKYYDDSKIHDVINYFVYDWSISLRLYHFL